MQPLRKGEGMTTGEYEEYIEVVRRRRQQMLKVAHALKRSKLDMMAMVLYQMADDVEKLIGMIKKEQ